MSGMMRCAGAVAIFITVTCLPSGAQRGGARGGGARGGGAHAGGFAARSAPAFHSSFAPARSFVSVPRYSVARPAAAASSLRYSARPTRYPVSGPDRYRRPYRPVSGGAVLYTAPLYWPGYSFAPDYGLYGDEGDSTYAAPQPEDYGAVAPPPEPVPAPVEQADVAPPRAYRRDYVTPQPAEEPEPPVTLVFKDGRPQEQVNNYLLTRTTLYVLDGPRREVPVDDLDMTATRKINHDAGIDFQLPGAVR